jgi:hypothetical protein
MLLVILILYMVKLSKYKLYDQSGCIDVTDIEMMNISGTICDNLLSYQKASFYWNHTSWTKLFTSMVPDIDL